MTAFAANPWRTKRSILVAEGISKSTFKRRVSDGVFEKRDRPSGRGKEYRFASPANSAQLALLTSDAWPESKPASVALRHLTPEQQSVAQARLELIRPMIEFREGGRADDAAPKFQSLNEVAKWISSANGCSAQRVWKFYSRLKQAKGDVTALARQPRPERGTHKSIEKFPGLDRFIAAKWGEVANIAHVHTIIRREWGGSLLPYGKELAPPKYGAIRRFVVSIPEAIRDVARLPKQVSDAKHAPYLLTGRAEHARANETWVADHRLYDVLLYNDSMPYLAQGTPLRLWETCVQDMRTRVIVGSIWSFTPSWRTIAEALKQGIGVYGVPEIFYCDNGKDFRKIAAGALHAGLPKSGKIKLDEDGRIPSSLGLLARLGIKVRHCIPHHPQSKQIESYFSFVSKRFDKLFFQHGYTGAKPEQRSDFCRTAEKDHKDFLAGKRRSTPLFGTSQFRKMHEQWLRECNESHPHSGRGMNGRPPLAVMNELLPPAQRRIPDMGAIDDLFWQVEKRKITNCKVTLNGTTYSAALDDSEGLMNLYLMSGKEIAVHCDPSDMAHARAYEDAPNGRFLARLISDELAICDHPVTEEAMQANARNQAKFRKASRAVWRDMTAGVPLELELLSKRSTGTDGRANDFGFARGKTAHTALPEPKSVASSSAFVSDAVKKYPAFLEGVGEE